MLVKVYSDGGSRGNPGPAAFGVVVCNEHDEVIKTHRLCIGESTNNIAEYTGLIAASECAFQMEADEVQFHMDSELVIKQMRGEYKVKDEKMKALYLVAKEDEKRFKSVTYTHLRREHPMMQQADEQVNIALDEKGF